LVEEILGRKKTEQPWGGRPPVKACLLDGVQQRICRERLRKERHAAYAAGCATGRLVVIASYEYDWERNLQHGETPSFERKARLEKLVVATNASWLRYSESFEDGIELLAAVDRMNLGGIGSSAKTRPIAPASNATG
jgi:hypothetical protein